MNAFHRSAILILILLLPATGANAQTSAQEAKVMTASITGQITVNSKPAPGVIVMLTRADSDARKTLAGIFGQKETVKATTDSEGVYRIANLAAGRYSITPFAPALVIPAEPGGGWPPGRIINIAESETLEKIDFALTRGGVITGHITDAQGQPLVAESLTLTPVDATDKNQTLADPFAGTGLGNSMYMTDDRGVYRLYGLPAGRYLVSVGKSGNSPLDFNLKRRYNAQTFHPGVTDKTKATAVEVKDGSEATGIDIRLGLPSQTYKASGRVIDATTGKPLALQAANYGATFGDSKMVLPRGLGAITDAKGEFHFETVVPGKYEAFVSFDEGSDSYSEPTPFEVSDSDVTGLTIKVRRGLTVSGTIGVEGTDDPAILNSLTQVQLSANVMGTDPTAPRELRAAIGGDGTFRVVGVQPGTMRFYVNRFFVPTKLAVLRVERNGMNQPKGLQIAPGDKITDARIVLAVASGVLRGQIKVAGEGSLDDMPLEVAAHRLGDDDPTRTERSGVDASGRFVFEDLLPGQYELTVRAIKPDPTQAGNSGLARQTVSVSNENEANITLTVDLSKKKN
jgi:hypothetical protein